VFENVVVQGGKDEEVEGVDCWCLFLTAVGREAGRWEKGISIGDSLLLVLLST
jgi:hypothetical protein